MRLRCQGELDTAAESEDASVSGLVIPPVDSPGRLEALASRAGSKPKEQCYYSLTLVIPNSILLRP